MKPRTITNRNITREVLLMMADKIEGAWIGIRIAGLLLILSGWKSTAVARLFNLSRPSVISWIKKVNEEGVTSIEDKPRPGRPSKLNEKVVGVLEEALSKSPEEYKLSRFRWDSVVIVEFIKKKLNISLQPRQARNWLKKLGYVRKRPIHSYVQASDKGIKEFRQSLKKNLKNQERIKDYYCFYGRSRIFFAPKVRLGLGKKGSKPKVPTASRHQRLNLAGWVAPWVGWHGLMRIDKGNTDAFLLFLKYLHNRLKEFTVYLYADGSLLAQGRKGERGTEKAFKYSLGIFTTLSSRIKSSGTYLASSPV